MCHTQAGIKLNSLHSKEVAHALKKATTDRRVSVVSVVGGGIESYIVSVMKEKAASVGERIRQVRIQFSQQVGH